jgi:serine O-acetyltransferase
MPYGTPCSELYDPHTQRLELLRCEVEQLRKRLAELIEERDRGQAPAPPQERDRA